MKSVYITREYPDLSPPNTLCTVNSQLIHDSRGFTNNVLGLGGTVVINRFRNSNKQEILLPSGDLVSSGGKLSKHANMKINYNDKHKLSHKKHKG